MDGTRRTRYDAYKTVCRLVEELRNVKLFDAEANAILWAAEGLLLANLSTDADAAEAQTTFETLMDGVAADRWQDSGPTTAELQRRRLVEAFAECAPVEAVSALTPHPATSAPEAVSVSRREASQLCKAREESSFDGAADPAGRTSAPGPKSTEARSR